MENNFSEIQELLRRKADLQARYNLLPYHGSPEIKEKGDRRYLYMRERIASRKTSTYVGGYSEELYSMLLRVNREEREIKKELRKVEKELTALGYSQSELPRDVQLNLEFARANMKMNIYEQAVLEGVATSFPQTEEIIENGIVSGMTAQDVQKVLNLKHAWEFILDSDVIASPTNYHILCHIAKLVNEGFFADGGRIRGVPVRIGNSSYIPPLPIETVVIENIEEILHSEIEDDLKGIKLCLYCMKTQVFTDGNKRASVIFANHFLISHAAGMLVIPESEVPAFKKLLVKYYEGEDEQVIIEFLKTRCLHKAKKRELTVYESIAEGLKEAIDYENGKGSAREETVTAEPNNSSDD